ncbi:hypothetical protein ACFWNC_14510 [Streptomyces sp. NPDC058369]|uniref:hypothetical protein n=1 Tax=Streptomyces sp. NPDC058369 TaxID=3346462 RepID=UPI003649E21A
MKNIPSLKTMSGEELYMARFRMDIIRNHPETPNHVKQAAVHLINFYGAEIDARLAERAQES